eukprot:Skav234177  [mRNA]  locus=scaffold1377:14636:24758:- [translate_table: standard]
MTLIIAERVSRALPLFFSSYLVHGTEEALRRAFQSAQNDLESSFGPMQVYSGATVVMCCINAESVWYANVGDSRLVIGDMEKGEPVYCSTEHKAHDVEEYKRLEAAGAQVIQKRYDDGEVVSRVFIPKTGVPGLAMSRSMGDGCLKKYGVTAEPDIFNITDCWNSCALPGMLMGSDGLWVDDFHHFHWPRLCLHRFPAAADDPQPLRAPPRAVAGHPPGAAEAAALGVARELCHGSVTRGVERCDTSLGRERAKDPARDWNGLTKHLGAKAYDAYDTLYEGVVLMTKSKPEAWWNIYQVNCDKLTDIDLKPVVAFVNTRSGGQQGMKVLREMRAPDFQEMQAYLHISQLVDLQRAGPEAALRWWDKTTLQYRILVSLGSVVSALN